MTKSSITKAKELVANSQLGSSIDEARYWHAHEGDVIAGEVVGFGKRLNRYGKEQQLLYLRDENDIVWSVWQTSFLKRRLAELKVTSGDTVGIKRVESHGRTQMYVVRKV